MTLTIGNKSIFGDYKVIINNISFEEFLEFTTEDISCELLNGALIITSPASYRHESIFRFLLTYLDQVGLKRRIGRAIGSRFVVRLDPKWGPEPDIVFYRQENKQKIKNNYYDGVPDLIIEILSPTNRDDDITIKLPKYLSFKVPEVWIIDPESRTLELYTSSNVKLVFNVENNVVQSKIFPELKFQLEWLWDDKYDPIQCLKELFKDI